MQPTLQQSQIAHNRVSAPLAPQRNHRKETRPPLNSGHDMGHVPPIPVDLARNLLALLPGRAALLDASGLVIAWNDHPSPDNEYESAPRPADIGLIVAPLNNAGGITLVWAPEADNNAGDTDTKPSRALTASRAQIYDLTSRLMHAQEDERKKIARELHDDLGQRLAAHALAIGNLKQHLPRNPVSLKERLLALETDAVELGDAIRIVSHELHPALLERLGLADALRTFAGEFCEWSGLRLVSDIENAPAPIPGIVALATYRIVQEAVRNIERHAHATTVKIKLRFTAHQLHLVIEDDGIGFKTDDASGKKGLGLTSIEERVHLLNGRLSIESPPGQGTILAVHIPTHFTGP